MYSKEYKPLQEVNIHCTFFDQQKYTQYPIPMAKDTQISIHICDIFYIERNPSTSFSKSVNTE